MSTKSDEELEEVREALRLLANTTISTLTQVQPNEVVAVDAVGFHVRTRRTVGPPPVVSWNDVLGTYSRLRTEGQVTNRKGVPPYVSRGAFVLAALSRLSTVLVESTGDPRLLKYRPDGRPVRLKT